MSTTGADHHLEATKGSAAKRKDKKECEEPSSEDHIQPTGERDLTYLHCTTGIPDTNPVHSPPSSKSLKSTNRTTYRWKQKKKRHKTSVDHGQ